MPHPQKSRTDRPPPSHNDLRDVERWNHPQAHQLLLRIVRMLKERDETVEWHGEYCYIASKCTVPAVILNACSATLDPPIKEHEFVPRGLSLYNPGGCDGQTKTIFLVLGPTTGKDGNGPTCKAAKSNAKQPLMRCDLKSSHQRLNMLRCILHIYPFSTSLDGFGQLGEHLKRFQKADCEKHRVFRLDEYEHIGELCPIEYENSTLEVLLKMFPEHMQSLFELRFIIRTLNCSCKDHEPDRCVAITSMNIDCSDGTAVDTEERIGNVFKRYRQTCCFGCSHEFEIQNAPPILAVLWNPGSEGFCYPRLDIALTKVFKLGNSEDLTYQLVSVGCGRRSSPLWRAHCKIYATGRWRCIKDPDNIGIYSWENTCQMWSDKNRLQLFYVKTSAIPNTSDDPNSLSEGRWVQAKYMDGKALYPAQVTRIWKTKDSELRFKIKWDDNDKKDTFKSASDLFPLLDMVDKISKFQYGDKVMVRKGLEKGKDKLFPGVISRCFTNYQYLISWDDGDEHYRVTNESAIQRKTENPDVGISQEHGRHEAMQIDPETTPIHHQPLSIDEATKTTPERGAHATVFSETMRDASDSEASLKIRTPRTIRKQRCLDSSDEEVADGEQDPAQIPHVSYKTPARTKKITPEFKDSAQPIARQLRSQGQTEHDKDGAVHVSVYFVFLILIKFCSSGIRSWFSQVQPRCPQDMPSVMSLNAAVLFFVEDQMFVEGCSSQFGIDLLCIDAVRHLPRFQLNAENDEFAQLDSNCETISLPDGVLRLVAFQFPNLRYGSQTGIVILYQMKLFGVDSMFLVSVDSSFIPANGKQKKNLSSFKIEAIEQLGRLLIVALTEFNTKNSDAPIPILHVPEFPKQLGIRRGLDDSALTRALVAGMAKQHNHQSSPEVTMASQHRRATLVRFLNDQIFILFCISNSYIYIADVKHFNIHLCTAETWLSQLHYAGYFFLATVEDIYSRAVEDIYSSNATDGNK